MSRALAIALAFLSATPAARAAEPPEQHMTNEVTFKIYPLELGEDEAPPPEEPVRGAFDIVISAGPTLAGNAAALAAFNRAAAQWEAFISDPIIVTVTADLVNLGGGGVLGSTSVVTLSTSSYPTLRTRWIADADADDDILASLPTSRSFTVPAGFGVSTSTLGAKASFKAIGGFGDLDGTFGANDATINFNTQFTFDFDNSNGVTPGQTDFETVAAHEIGHALGFTSTVDTVDQTVFNGQTATVIPTTLDHLRFLNGSPTDPANAANFSTFARDLRPNVDAISDFIASQGAEAAENRMSTGRLTGDARQASHWKDDSLTGVNIGLMDPSLAPATVTPISDADTRAIDLIGYDILLFLDCNQNNVPDGDDIASGTSDDCNANGTPDECDIAAATSLDCNANMIPDDCDIAAGTSDDCNANGTPDDCDVTAPVVTSYSQTPNAAIPDNNITGISRSIVVPDSGAITDLDVGLHINHTWQGDLVVTLSHSGVTRTLINRSGLCADGNFGYSADNFGSAGNLLVLDDAAPTSIDCYAGGGSAGIFSYAGPAQANQALSAFNGLDRAGTWTLTVSDRAMGDIGTLVTWRLDVGTPPVDCNANGIPDECESGCGPSVSVVSAVSRKANPSGPAGICDISMLPSVRTEPRQGGVTEVRIGFNAPPGGPGPDPITLKQATCAAPAYAPYAGASVTGASVVGNQLVLGFTPALENARTYRIELGGAVTSIAGQFVEVRALVGDVNHNGAVNGNDRSVVIGAWTSPGGFSCETDLNASGATNGNDRSIVIAAWTGTGTNCSP